MKKNQFIILTSLLASFATHAESSTTTTTPTGRSETSLGSPISNKKFEDDKDITDAKLKADSGSLSRISLKVSLEYKGAPISDLNNPMQPNPDGTVAVNETSLGGSIGSRFRLDSKSTIGIGTGVNALTPLQGTKRYDVKNPYLSYDRNSKISEIQMRNSISLSAITIQTYRTTGEYGGISLDNSLVYNIGSSSFALALDTSLNYYLFEREYLKSDRKVITYQLAFYPAVKYNVTDALNFNSSLAIGYYNPRDTKELSVLSNKVLSQRLAMGYAFSKTIYISPYLNFYPNQLNTDTTTLNIATTFSVL